MTYNINIDESSQKKIIVEALKTMIEITILSLKQHIYVISWMMRVAWLIVWKKSLSS